MASRDSPPPAYSSSHSHQTLDLDSLRPASLTSYLQNQVSALPERTRASQQSHSAQEAQDDILLLHHLVPAVEDFLVDLGSQKQQPPLATLILVPHDVVPVQSELSGIEGMRARGEFVRLVRVDTEGKQQKSIVKSDVPMRGRNEISSYLTGRDASNWKEWLDTGTSGAADAEPQLETLWWRDETMACRLAQQLQPESQPVEQSVEPQGAAEANKLMDTEPKEDGKGWSWKKRKAGRDAKGVTRLTGKSPEDAGSYKRETGKATNMVNEFSEVPQMNVTAEQIAFRQENALGLWESHKGWAIMVEVKIS